MSNVYIFIGAPGAGKGTLGEIFCEKNGIIHVSTGQLLRDEMTNGTELGKQVKDIIAKGALVSDEIVAQMVKNRLAQPDIQAHGALLDGFPRTEPQAQMLNQILAEGKDTLAAVVLIEVDEKILIERLTARRLCSNKDCGAMYNLLSLPPKVAGICDKCGAPLIQRSDDTEATAKDRLKEYHEKTAPLIDFYEKQGKLLRTPSIPGSIEGSYDRLAQALADFPKR